MIVFQLIILKNTDPKDMFKLKEALKISHLGSRDSTGVEILALYVCGQSQFESQHHICSPSIAKNGHWVSKNYIWRLNMYIIECLHFIVEKMKAWKLTNKTLTELFSIRIGTIIYYSCFEFHTSSIFHELNHWSWHKT